MSEPWTLKRRYRRDTNRMPIVIEIQRSRCFVFSIPEGVPYDCEDSDRIERELGAMQPRPDEIQGPVASGLGDLVCDSFAVTFTDDKREDWEIMLDIEEAVRAGLVNRAWAYREGASSWNVQSSQASRRK